MAHPTLTRSHPQQRRQQTNADMDGSSHARDIRSSRSQLSAAGSATTGGSHDASTVSSILESDNESLRQKLQNLRDENAQLVAENHQLLTRAENDRYTLHKLTSRVQTADDAIEKYRQQVKDLSDAIFPLQEAYKVLEKTCSEKTQQFADCNRQLQESSVLIQLHLQTIEVLNNELADLKRAKKKVEGL